MPNVVCTPHLGASTEEAQTQVAIEACQLIINYLTSGEIRHAVNAASVDPKTLAALRGYIDLAYRLGRFLAQWQTGAIESCSLNYRGEVADKDTRLLTSAFCAGLLEGAMEEEVNIINADVLLREIGIALSEEKQVKAGVFSSSMQAELVRDGQKLVAAGTLFGQNMPRLIRLDDYRLEAYLDGNLFVFKHRDVPGIIGAVGSIFGKHGINIAQMSVGRTSNQPGGEAVGVLNLDGVPDQATIDDLLNQEGVLDVKVVKLPAAGQVPTWL
jgi:D-3-phosphoglycerate dehydrogenase